MKKQNIPGTIDPSQINPTHPDTTVMSCSMLYCPGAVTPLCNGYGEQQAPVEPK